MEDDSLINISIVFIGHVNTGKSTTAGHFIYECGGIDQEKMVNIEMEAINFGKNPLKYALILDKVRTERAPRVVDLVLWRLNTSRYSVNVVDTPGHSDYIKNVIAGTTLADCAVLVVSAVEGEFEAGIAPTGQTLEHLMMAYTFCVKELIVAVNKMDLADWSEARFTEIASGILLFLKKVGYEPETIVFVPISGWDGDNIIEPSVNLAWYQEWRGVNDYVQSQSKTLLEAINSVMPPIDLSDRPLRVPVRQVKNISEIGTIALGRVESGAIRPAMTVLFAPASITADVWTVEVFNPHLTEEEANTDIDENAVGRPNDNVGFNVGYDIEKLSFKKIRRGDVCGDVNNDPPKLCLSFNADIVIVYVPEKLGTIQAGYTPYLRCHIAQEPCTLEVLISKYTRDYIKVDSPQELLKGETAFVTFIPRRPLCVEAYSDYPALSRFIIRDVSGIVGYGIVKSVEKYTSPPDSEASSPELYNEYFGAPPGPSNQFSDSDSPPGPPHPDYTDFSVDDYYIPPRESTETSEEYLVF